MDPGVADNAASRFPMPKRKPRSIVIKKFISDSKIATRPKASAFHSLAARNRIIITDTEESNRALTVLPDRFIALASQFFRRSGGITTGYFP
jgi:hypothetical protein